MRVRVSFQAQAKTAAVEGALPQERGRATGVHEGAALPPSFSARAVTTATAATAVPFLALPLAHGSQNSGQIRAPRHAWEPRRGGSFTGVFVDL